MYLNHMWLHHVFSSGSITFLWRRQPLESLWDSHYIEVPSFLSEGISDQGMDLCKNIRRQQEMLLLFTFWLCFELHSKCFNMLFVTLVHVASWWVIAGEDSAEPPNLFQAVVFVSLNPSKLCKLHHRRRQRGKHCNHLRCFLICLCEQRS